MARAVGYDQASRWQAALNLLGNTCLNLVGNTCHKRLCGHALLCVWSKMSLKGTSVEISAPGAPEMPASCPSSLSHESQPWGGSCYHCLVEPIKTSSLVLKRNSIIKLQSSCNHKLVVMNRKDSNALFFLLGGFCKPKSFLRAWQLVREGKYIFGVLN